MYLRNSTTVFILETKEILSRIAAPTLVMVGENDPGTPVDTARQIRTGNRDSVKVQLPMPITCPTSRRPIYSTKT